MGVWWICMLTGCHILEWMAYPLCRISPYCEWIKFHNGDDPFKTSSVYAPDSHLWLPPPTPPHSTTFLFLSPYFCLHFPFFLIFSFTPQKVQLCMTLRPQACLEFAKCKVHSRADGQAAVPISSEAWFSFPVLTCVNLQWPELDNISYLVLNLISWFYVPASKPNNPS